MKLWDDTIDSYRSEANALLEHLPSTSIAEADLPEDPVARAELSREYMRAMEPDPSTMAVEDTIPGPAGDIPVKLFVPDEPKAMFLHIHGGGWILGRPQMNDLGNEHLAQHHSLAVLSVDYRLAPEHPYPAGPDDCEAAAAWLLNHGLEQWGTDKMFIGGESAGGHLAAVTLLRVQDRLGAIDRVLGANLVFGVYDLRGTPSIFDNGGNPDMLDPAGIQFMIESFTPGMSDAERRDPDVSPLFADLSGLPPQFGLGGHLRPPAGRLAVLRHPPGRGRVAGGTGRLPRLPPRIHGPALRDGQNPRQTPRHLDRLAAALAIRPISRQNPLGPAPSPSGRCNLCSDRPRCHRARADRPQASA